MDVGLGVVLLWLSQTLFISCSAQYPTFRSEPPSSVVQARGSAVRLRCSVSPATASVSWRFRGLPLEELGGATLELGRASLTIHSLQRDHEGVYQCVARLDHGAALASRHVRVAIAEISEYEENRRRSLAVQEGSAVVIECPLPRSVPPALPRLRVRGERLEASTGDYLVLPSGNLQILSVSAQHQGMYKCGAYNPVTGETRTQAHGTKLSVKHSEVGSPVRIAYPVAPQTITAERSRPLTLECVVTGSPAPAVRWLKDGKEVVAAAAAGGPGHLRTHGNNLALASPTLSDEGSYQCTVKTESGVLTSANYTVNIQEPVSVVTGPSDQSVPPGSTVTFTCTPGGNPAPNVTWLFNAQPLVDDSSSSSSSSSRHRFRISGPSLTIADVTFRDEGVYQCLVDNGIGSAQSSATLSVQSQSHPGSTAAAGGDEDVLLEASASLHPMQSDEGEELLVAPEGEGDEEGGEEGGRGGREDAAVAVDLPADRSGERPTPEAPIIISPPQTHKPDVYDLEWRAGRDGGSPINAYFVKYRKVDEMGAVVGSWSTVRVPGSEKTLRLSELESSSLYEVLMVARNAAGEGQPAMLTFRTGKEKSVPVNKKPSKPPVVSMPPQAPEDKTPTHFGVVIHDRVPEAPDRPTISMATESSVYVTWIPRANGGSPITAFRVEYRRGRSAEWLIAADNISPLKLSVEVRSLEPGATYKFRVFAINMYGESPHSIPSKPYQVSQASPPYSDRPVAGPHISSTDAISDTQIMLRWTYTPSSNNNTPIQGFYIYYRPTDSDNDSDYKRDVVEGVKHWHMIGHLQPETSYDIKMQCFNDGGESEYSNVMICETRARQVPGVPSQHPVTPPGPHAPEAPSSPGGLLYLIVGCVLGVMVLILLAFIAMCLWRNRQQINMHKYDPPGYLYQPAEMNGHVMEYTALPGSGSGGRLNGGGGVGVHGGGYGMGHHGGPPMLPPGGCHHLHHKLPNGLGLLNGSGGGGGGGGLFSPAAGHPHDGSTLPPHAAVDCEHASHPHHHHNGGGMYTALPQTDSTDCMSCQNYCNNNRCYSKTNGTFSSGTLPLMHRVAPCHQQQQQQDGLEMVPLGQAVSPQCHGPDHHHHHHQYHHDGSGDRRPDDGDSDGGCSPSRLSCCLVGEGDDDCPGDDTAEEEPQCVDSEGPVVCWETLGLPDLDCDDKSGWLSGSSLAGELIQAAPQEV